jgi:F-type H+-transporting ATPase subunit delta
LINGSIPRRYAKALLSIGIEKKEYESYSTQLAQFASLLEYRDLRETLDNPSIPHSKRKALFEEFLTRLRPSGMVKNFLLLLLDRNRISALPAISREYQAISDDHAGRIRAAVTSASPLDPASLNRLKEAIEKKTGKQVLLQQQTDPDLIAGMVTKIGSIVYDGSIRTSLQQMRQSLLEGQP